MGAGQGGEGGAQETRQHPVAPVDVGGAYSNGYLYYPYRLKRVAVEEGVELSRYETRVLRSDGVSLGYGYKPAPRGTPAEDRVLALEDGTDVTRAPVAPGRAAVVQLDGHHPLYGGEEQRRKRAVPLTRRLARSARATP